MASQMIKFNRPHTTDLMVAIVGDSAASRLTRSRSPIHTGLVGGSTTNFEHQVTIHSLTDHHQVPKSDSRKVKTTPFVGKLQNYLVHDLE